MKPISELILKPILLAVNGDITRTIFTFDGRVYNIPRRCSFLLAKDAVNGNFSIVVEHANNKLESLIFTDKSGSVVVKEGKILLDNGEFSPFLPLSSFEDYQMLTKTLLPVPTDLPIKKGGLHVHYYPRYIEIKSSAGVTIYCSLIMVGCGIQVSGFYHGQLRGLLGKENIKE